MKTRFGRICLAVACTWLAGAVRAEASAGYRLRDARAGGDYSVLAAFPGLTLTERVERRGTAAIHCVRLAAADANAVGDRALTLAYDLPLPPGTIMAYTAPDRARRVWPDTPPIHVEERKSEAGQRAFPRWPFLAASVGEKTYALGLTPGTAALYRLTLLTKERVLRITYDLALTPERPTVDISFTEFGFDADRAAGYRGAWEAWQAIFADDYYRVRSTNPGGWMVGDALQSVPHPEDFGLRFCERGAHKTLAASAAWNAAHNIQTFRYSSTGAWSMRFKINTVATTADMTLSNAVAEARAQTATQAWNEQAKGWAFDCMLDRDGNPAGKSIDYAWCRGWAWSVISAHDARHRIDHRLPGETARLDALFGPNAAIPLDGEYCDSTDLFATTELDFNRAHFALVTPPLTWDAATFRPVIHKGFVGFDYLNHLSTNLHARGKMLMVNAAPKFWAWIPPMCDVLGMEADWGEKGEWKPFGRERLMLIRMQCGAKPFCVVQNTEFGPFGRHVEKYLQLCLAYGFLPGCFSPGSANDKTHYFANPEFYERDRALFKKYMPLCRRLAAAGWRAVNRLLPGVTTPTLSAEQFGDRHVALYNFSPTDAACVTVPVAATELVTAKPLDGTALAIPPLTCRVLAFDAATGK